MPLDKVGRFHGNIGRAMAADKNSMPAPKPKVRPSLVPRMASAAPPEPDGDESGAAGHLKEYQDAMGGGKAMLVHHDGMNITSHQIGEGGEVEGPHDHSNLEELKAAMDTFLDEEGAEPSAELGMASGDIKDVY